MSTMRDGEVLVYSSMTQVTQRIRVQGGFAEVNDKGLTVLAEHAEILSGATADTGSHGRLTRADH
jgi:F-type H+-transporting ATPase subunit epsilon